MKTIVKVMCCMVALAWMSGAVAKEEAMHSSLSSDDEVADSASADEGSAPAAGGSRSIAAPAAANVAEAAPAAAEDVVVSTPPAPRVPVMAHTEKVDRSQVEKKMEERSNRMKGRTADAEKDVAARAQPAQ